MNWVEISSWAYKNWQFLAFGAFWVVVVLIPYLCLIVSKRKTKKEKKTTKAEQLQSLQEAIGLPIHKVEDENYAKCPMCHKYLSIYTKSTHKTEPFVHIEHYCKPCGYRWVQLVGDYDFAERQKAIKKAGDNLRRIKEERNKLRLENANLKSMQSKMSAEVEKLKEDVIRAKNSFADLVGE